MINQFGRSEPQEPNRPQTISDITQITGRGSDRQYCEHNCPVLKDPELASTVDRTALLRLCHQLGGALSEISGGEISYVCSVQEENRLAEVTIN